MLILCDFRYGNDDIEAIVFGVNLGHKYKVIAESMGRTTSAIMHSYHRAIKIERWQEYQNEIKLKYGIK